MSADIPVITIDGPSGAGKGTLAKMLAQWLGWCFMDSGVFYRALALVVLDEQIPVNDEALVARRAKALQVDFIQEEDSYPVVVEGRRVGMELRSEDCATMASLVAAMPEVRAALLACQRSFRQAPGLVADGRDMGTVVFPDAQCKVFLTASVMERAQRRYKQLMRNGETVRLSGLLRDIEERDRRDRQRISSPLLPAEGATVIDTTGHDIAWAFARVLTVVAERYPELKQLQR